MWQCGGTLARRLREGPGGAEGPPPGGPELAQQPSDEALGRQEPMLLCASCQAPITTPGAAIEVSGNHAHTFLNPGGQVFRIRCFASAPGALPAGEESDYWTWFPGFHWQACLCRVCFEHLGWHFAGGGTPFFGLIHERIVEG